MSKSTYQGIAQTEIALDDTPQIFEVSSNVQQTLSRMMGFDLLYNTWRLFPVLPVDNVLVTPQNIVPVGAVSYFKIGTKYYPKHLPVVFKSINITGLANNATTDLWVPTTGYYWWMTAIGVRPSASGLYSLYSGSTLLAWNQIGAGVNSAMAGSQDGLSSVTLGDTLKIKNESGGASDIRAWAFGLEVLA